MMFLDDGQYPEIGRLIRDRIIPIHGRNPKVYEAFVQCAGSRKIAELAFSAGTYPRVKLEDLPLGKPIDRRIPGEWGNARMGDPTLNYIYIQKSTYRGFDGNPAGAEELERVILHEAVHWGVYRTFLFHNRIRGVEETSGRFRSRILKNGKFREAGAWFEYLAYDIAYQDHWGIPYTGD